MLSEELDIIVSLMRGRKEEAVREEGVGTDIDSLMMVPEQGLMLVLPGDRDPQLLMIETLAAAFGPAQIIHGFEGYALNHPLEHLDTPEKVHAFYAEADLATRFARGEDCVSECLNVMIYEDKAREVTFVSMPYRYDVPRRVVWLEMKQDGPIRQDGTSSGAVGNFPDALAAGYAAHEVPELRRRAEAVFLPPAGRNDQCPCGSKLKFKHCHGR